MSLHVWPNGNACKQTNKQTKSDEMTLQTNGDNEDQTQDLLESKVLMPH